VGLDNKKSFSSVLASTEVDSKTPADYTSSRISLYTAKRGRVVEDL